MKELSIEEKAKAYDEAIKRAQAKMEEAKVFDYDDEQTSYTIRLTTTDIFPELKESEDEKIRKSLIGHLKECRNNTRSEVMLGEYAKWIAWLEKHGEQKPEQKFFINDKVVHKATGKIWTIHHYLKDTNSYYVEDNDGLLHHYRESELKLVEQKPTIEMKSAEESLGIDSETYNKILDECIYGEQKPVKWSEEDEKNLDWLITVCERIHYKSDPQVSPKGALVLKDWLKSLKDRCLPQPKQEWSEEDEKLLNNAITACNHCYFQTTANWLKSLRPQNTWKPSDEQMEALDSATENCAYSEYQDCLRELIGQLKKLREG